MTLTPKTHVYLTMRMRRINGRVSQRWHSSQVCDLDSELSGRHSNKGTCGEIIDALRAEFGRGNVALDVSGVETSENDQLIADATPYARACVTRFLGLDA